MFALMCSFPHGEAQMMQGQMAGCNHSDMELQGHCRCLSNLCLGTDGHTKCWPALGHGSGGHHSSTARSWLPQVVAGDG